MMPKVFDVLVHLVERYGHLVEKRDLLNTVWADTFVEEANIARIIHELRKILGEDKDGNVFIETVAKKGYRFVARVNEVTQKEDPRTEIADQNVAECVNDPELKESEIQSSNTDRSVIQPATQPRHNARIIFFSLGGVTAIALIVLLSFSFQSGSSSEAKGVRSIAVLPVKPIDAANRDEIYEVGIAESLINWLGSVKGFVVRPLSAIRKYASIEQDEIAAGREQQVDYVLTSNYQLAGGKIRFTAHLLSVGSGQIEETYKVEKDATDLFAMQDAIASDVGNFLKAKFTVTSTGPATKRGTDNEEAYRCYLKGVALVDRGHWADVRTAIEYFEQAVRIDPNYALAYARLANAQTTAALNLSSDRGEQYPKAKVAIEKALALDENLAEAHSYLGEIMANLEGDFVGAEHEHKRAIELDPNSSVAHRMYAILLTYLGRREESIAESNTAIDLDPSSTLNHLIHGRAFLFARRYDEAITELERTAEMDPGFFYAYQSLSIAYRYKGDDDRSFDSFVRTRILAEDEPNEINSWKTIYAKSGWRGVLARQLEQTKMVEKKGKPNYDQLANLSSELGLREQAFAYLEKALSHSRTITMLKVHPRYDSLRDDPRFEELLRRVGLN